MASQRPPTRQRLINAALELFASQGVTETTTRQIAELAEVNEVTLFRQFGNKHGLLLAVIEETAVFTSLTQSLIQQAAQVSSLEQALKDYADSRLEAIETIPELVRSLVGEAGQYPLENRQALGREITQGNRFVAQYLETAIQQGKLHTHLPTEKLASLLNSLLLGYAILDFTSEFHQLWENRHDFLENLVILFLQGAVAQGPKPPVRSGEQAELETGPILVADLPAQLVHGILRQAKKRSLQDYALMYVLFSTGLSPQEITLLKQTHHICDRHQHLLQIPRGTVRQVPINQWILGKRYGSYTSNPLTQWLKSRKDDHPALFLNAGGETIAVADIDGCWQHCTEGLLTPNGQPPMIQQAQYTWCVEMLVKGMSLENLSLLTGLSVEALQPYAQRAREKLALEQAIQLDQKPGKGTNNGAE